uniref:Uncharacterized protein n=1 Tax=Rhizophora mucronata TaxID=61149 RepID=A0A2P2JFM6_RHIMU
MLRFSIPSLGLTELEIFRSLVKGNLILQTSIRTMVYQELYLSDLLLNVHSRENSTLRIWLPY